MPLQRLPCSPYFSVLSSLNRENVSDHKVALVNHLDMSSAERLRHQAGLAGGTRPSYTALVAKALANALRLHPAANRMVFPGPFGPRMFQFEAIDISVAVERDSSGFDQAACTETMRAVDDKDIAAITRELAAIVRGTSETHQRWRLFRRLVEHSPAWFARTVVGVPRLLASQWVQHRGGVALISSPAKYGVDTVVGTWPYPIGISFGLVKPRPVAIGDRVEVRPTMDLLMSFDRRLMAGAPAARFFRTISDQLEDAEHRLAPAAPAPLCPIAAA
ncbi:MAG: 2-oxo acid dehydrogenase subunit E2 [Planctomycetes bacterium]|nr:2-oxo acid dehydrogenase subunit E2 [Planctomycetota bacterium]